MEKSEQTFSRQTNTKNMLLRFSMEHYFDKKQITSTRRQKWFARSPDGKKELITLDKPK